MTGRREKDWILPATLIELHINVHIPQAMLIVPNIQHTPMCQIEHEQKLGKNTINEWSEHKIKDLIDTV